MDWDTLSDTGLRRAGNQDAVLCLPSLGFFAVIDGMGGLPGGAQAAKTTQNELAARMKALAATQPGAPLPPAEAARSLAAAVEQLSDTLYRSLNRGGEIRFGATLCCVWFIHQCAIFVNIGDCRGYLLRRAGPLRQITRDHTLGQSLADDGLLPQAQAARSRYAARVTRFVGMQAPATVDWYRETIQPGDKILLCSDGLYKTVGDVEIAHILGETTGPARACRSLLHAARHAGAQDDFTALCVQIGREENPPHTAI